MPDSTLTPEQTQALLSSLLDSGKTPPAKLGDLELVRDPTTQQPIAYRDPATGNTITIPPPKAQTTDVTSPAETTWVDISGPLQQGQTQQQQGHRIVNGQLQAIPGLTRAKPASDTSGAPQWIPDPQDPTKEIQVVYSGTTALPVSANGAVVSRPKKTEPGAGPTNVGGARWIPDPSNPSNEIEVVTTLSPDGTPTNKPTGATRKAPATAPTAAGNVIWQDIPDQPGKQQGGTVVDGTFVPVAGLIKDKDKKPVAVYGTGPNDKFRITLDDEGKVVSQVPNDNYVGEKSTQLTADLVAPNIPLLKPDGTVQWVPNQNRVPANQAALDLLEQANVKVNGGQLSMADAKDLLTGAVNTMNAQSSRMSAQAAQQQAANQAQQNIATAAGDVLRNTATNAQTGAGMLNQRVSSATSALSNMMGTIGSSKITDIPSDFGKNLVGGLSNWVTNMGGGDAVYETAARMVQGADPKISGDPTLAQQATQTLAQMMQQYQTQSGKPYPDVAATIAAKGSQAANGVVAPVTIAGNAQGQQTNVGVDQALQQQQAAAAQQAQAQAAAMKARGLLDDPQGRAIAAGQTPVAMQGAPTTPGLYNPAWQQGIISGVGLPSVGPNAANGFVAPPLPLIPA